MTPSPKRVAAYSESDQKKKKKPYTGKKTTPVKKTSKPKKGY